MNIIYFETKSFILKTGNGKRPEFSGLGFAYLRELVCKPNALIHCTELRNLLNQAGTGADELISAHAIMGDRINLGFSIGGPELPIGAIDLKTITNVKRSLLKLLEQKAEALIRNDLAWLEDVQDEIDKLIEYLQDNMTPHGKIKVLHSRSHADYRAVYKAIKRAIQIISEIKPDYATIINEHLVTGIYFLWKEEDIV